MGNISGVHMALASCIGCGCTDRHACVGDEGPCSWIVVDYDVGRGVCSCCQSHLARWNDGDRSVLMLVAKVTKDGEAEPFYIEKNAMGSFPAAHQAEAQRLALAVAELGFDVYDLIDLDELPGEFLPA